MGGGGGGPEECEDAYPPGNEGTGNIGDETGPDKRNYAEGCGGEEECERLSVSAGTCANAWKCGCVVGLSLGLIRRNSPCCG
jgi:hypothetical protein